MIFLLTESSIGEFEIGSKVTRSCWHELRLATGLDRKRAALKIDFLTNLGTMESITEYSGGNFQVKCFKRATFITRRFSIESRRLPIKKGLSISDRLSATQRCSIAALIWLLNLHLTFRPNFFGLSLSGERFCLHNVIAQSYHSTFSQIDTQTGDK